ncbi:MAG: hypothetical protein FWF04_01545 [Clostridiales bacterium]|nr:hypothetical protein [Clostridiales bacterium]
MEPLIIIAIIFVASRFLRSVGKKQGGSAQQQAIEEQRRRREAWEAAQRAQTAHEDGSAERQPISLEQTVRMFLEGNTEAEIPQVTIPQAKPPVVTIPPLYVASSPQAQPMLSKVAPATPPDVKREYIQDNMLVRGIIMAEILGPPRAKARKIRKI